MDSGTLEEDAPATADTAEEQLSSWIKQATGEVSAPFISLMYATHMSLNAGLNSLSHHMTVNFKPRSRPVQR